MNEGSILISYLKNIPNTLAQLGSSGWRNTAIFFSVVGIFIVLVLVIFLYLLFSGKFTLKNKKKKDEDLTDISTIDFELEGATGKAMSDLRPSGVAIINDKRIEVTSTGKMISQNAPIKVVEVKGSKVTVEEIGGMW
ncbi:MAG: hypothetical protein K8T10_15595 [Candidatus Eremiobacteraeota bacterium]|nr:hypothetical protein [Candidatus Eremiobacteraeota bacterium]